MQLSLLKRHVRTIVLVALALWAATLLVFALIRGSMGAAAQAKPRHAAHHARHHAKHHARAAETQGETSGENESSVESEQGQPGEPANGHQDAPGANVNNECTGDCVQ